MVILITYDLHRPGQNYTELHEQIKSLGAWWHHLESTWLVDTQLNPEQVWNYIASKVDKNDTVFVTRITNVPKYSGWLTEEAWVWLRQRNF